MAQSIHANTPKFFCFFIFFIFFDYYSAYACPFFQNNRNKKFKRHNNFFYNLILAYLLYKIKHFFLVICQFLKIKKPPLKRHFPTISAPTPHLCPAHSHPRRTTNPKFICINQPIKAFCQQVRLARTCPDRAFPLMPMRRAQPTAQLPYPHKSKRLALASLSPGLFTPFMQVARPLSRGSPLINK